MITLPKALVDKFNDWLGRETVDTKRHGEYRKWLRNYLSATNTGMCQKNRE